MAGYGAVRKAGAGGARSSPYGEDEAELELLMASLSEEHGVDTGADTGAAAGSGASGEVCQFFAKAGWCKFGDQCKHLHVGEAVEKEPCQFFAKTGWCKWGDLCKHAHIGEAKDPSDQDLITLMTKVSGGGGGGGGREVCQFFANTGWCKWADQCKHLHTGVGAKGGAAKGLAPAKGGGTKGGASVLAQVVAAVQGCGKGAGAFGGGGAVESCQFFAQNGWCKWGDQCKHAHAGVPTAGAPGGGKGPGAAAAAIGAVLAAAKGGWADAGAGAWGALGGAKGGGQEICQFFAKSGWCKWGDQCKHRHAAAITPPPAAVKGNAIAPPPAAVKGNVVVPPPAAARCIAITPPPAAVRGNAITPPPAAVKGKSAGKGLFPAAAAGGAPPSSSGEACGFFAKTGWCKWGDQCKHMHIRDESTPSGVQKEPCQFFAKSGWCKWGDQCKHSHIFGAEAAEAAEVGVDSSMEITTDALLAEISSMDFGSS